MRVKTSREHKTSAQYCTLFKQVKVCWCFLCLWYNLIFILPSPTFRSKKGRTGCMKTRWKVRQIDLSCWGSKAHCQPTTHSKTQGRVCLRFNGAPSTVSLCLTVFWFYSLTSFLFHMSFFYLFPSHQINTLSVSSSLSFILFSLLSIFTWRILWSKP